ncbi:hypothetical protein [Agromyces kandeliae]|uniref:DUF4386 family protein n=1 Tax=Agromyces kandeliae TaxID=2666141 RepID=A0A6L5QZQ6_9MICO|nr:hypothetical protein [Agromyces kandeliae]MRX42678.1 hypothetical protein [Agromyces kandeliae]
MTTGTHPETVPSTTPRRFHASRYLGAAFAVVFLAGLVLISLPPYVYGGTLADWASGVDDEARLNLLVGLSTIVFPVAGILLMWSAAHLRTAIDHDRPRPSIPGQLAVLGAAVTSIGVVVAASASAAAAHVVAPSADGGFPAVPEVAYGLEMFSSQVLNPSFFGLSLMVFALSVGLRRVRRLPGWLAWAGCILAPLLPVAWMLGMIPLLLAAVWVAIATAVVDTEPQG